MGWIQWKGFPSMGWNFLASPIFLQIKGSLKCYSWGEQGPPRKNMRRECAAGGKQQKSISGTQLLDPALYLLECLTLNASGDYFFFLHFYTSSPLFLIQRSWAARHAQSFFFFFKWVKSCASVLLTEVLSCSRRKASSPMQACLLRSFYQEKVPLLAEWVYEIQLSEFSFTFLNVHRQTIR